MKDLGGLGLKLSARSYSYERASILLISEKLEKESHTPRSESGRLFPRHTQHLEFKSSANHVTWVHTQNYLNYEEKESKHHGCGLALRQPRKAQVENVGSGWLEEGRRQRWACEEQCTLLRLPGFSPLSFFLTAMRSAALCFPSLLSLRSNGISWPGTENFGSMSKRHRSFFMLTQLRHFVPGKLTSTAAKGRRPPADRERWADLRMRHTWTSGTLSTPAVNCGRIPEMSGSQVLPYTFTCVLYDIIKGLNTACANFPERNMEASRNYTPQLWWRKKPGIL